MNRTKGDISDLEITGMTRGVLQNSQKIRVESKISLLLPNKTI